MVQKCSSLLLVWLWRHLGWILYPHHPLPPFSDEHTKFWRRSHSDLLGNRIPQCTMWSSAAHWHACRLSCLRTVVSELITEKCCSVIWSDATFSILQQRKEVQGSGAVALEASPLWDLSNNPKRFCLARVIKWLWLCYNWCELNSWNGGGTKQVWGGEEAWQFEGIVEGGVSTRGTSRWGLSTITIRNYSGWRHWCERISILSNKFFFFFFLTRYTKNPFLYLVDLSVCLSASRSSSFPTRFLRKLLC